MDQKIIQASNEYKGLRIDKFLSEQNPDYSRSYIQKLIKDGQVSVSGKAVKSNYKIDGAEEIVLLIPEQIVPDILPENIPLDILYEDQDLIVINKPKGMVVHPAAGIVHRIDQNTTGSLLVCKNDYAHNFIASQLKVHSITRKYRAIVHGNIKEDHGTIDAPIGRHPIDRKKMAIEPRNGREAVTHFQVLERFGNYTYIECQLETGRTHQIRVHMSSIHHPIVGDDVYGPAKCPFSGLQGQTLHAQVLGFIHPRTKEYMEFSAPLPEYFESLLQKLRH